MSAGTKCVFSTVWNKYASVTK